MKILNTFSIQWLRMEYVQVKSAAAKGITLNLWLRSAYILLHMFKEAGFWIEVSFLSGAWKKMVMVIKDGMLQ